MASIEEKVEEYVKSILDDLGIRHFGKTEEINSAITNALRNSSSKSGGSGTNYPDIQLLLENKNRRDIPVMIEIKGKKGKLEKLTSTGDIELKSNGKNPNRAVQEYAMNGALHYGNCCISFRYSKYSIRFHWNLGSYDNSQYYWNYLWYRWYCPWV